MDVSASVDLKLEPSTAFDEFVDELSMALSQVGIEFAPGPGGRISERGSDVGKVLTWLPGKEISFDWRPADWKPDEATKVEIRFGPVGEDRTRVTIEHYGWGRFMDDSGGELAGWFAGEIAAPLVRAMAPPRFGDWVTDRRARRPSGAQARATYRDPLYHRPNFKAILSVLELKTEDDLLEVGCGGGALLQDALKSGCRAAAIDHSPDMVRLTREVNSAAITEKRLEVHEGDAESLPFPDGRFTCAVMTGVFGFIEDPLKALSEVHRVLARGGRLVLFTGSKELRGTPAAPEPMASRLHFYEDEELEGLARAAGFASIRFERPDFARFAREAGVPEEHLALFSGRGGGQLLVASKKG